MNGNGCKPKIDYPCPWTYKVIGRNEEDMCGAIAEILQEHKHTVTPSRSSSSGAYHCLNVALIVDSDAERLALYERLRNHPAVIMVM